jgi:hypothetical protein
VAELVRRLLDIPPAPEMAGGERMPQRVLRRYHCNLPASQSRSMSSARSGKAAAIRRHDLPNPAQNILLHRRVPYDIDRAQKRFKNAGLPAENAARIAFGG